ncbi:MAG: hypothetical protein AAGK32_02985, partial [Actinomycetota bacterium]
MSEAPTATPGGPFAHLDDQDAWTDRDVESAGAYLLDVPLVSVGGGMGSFALVDYLRIAGVPTESMKVVTPLRRPHETYEYLCENSQIPRHERLRSDSQSTIDNIWGFPSYAWREAWADKSLKPLWQVLVEPILDTYYTPRAGQVYESLDREAERIDWDDMRVAGTVRRVRRRVGGGYFTAVRHTGSGGTDWLAIRSRFVHLSPGYGALRYLPDLQEYRTTYGDNVRVVNAYEPHDHVYARLQSRPGTVVVRGSGIVGARVLQRLVEDRDQRGAQTQILHLFLPGTWVGGPQGTEATFTRPGHSGFAYQGFNYPKASWGGQLREELFGMEGEERRRFLDQIGGINIPVRRDWQEQIARGLREGFYRQVEGRVERIEPGSGVGELRLDLTGADGRPFRLDADYIIDATGLIGGPDEHDLLGDLLQHTQAAKNPLGRLDVSRTFE